MSLWKFGFAFYVKIFTFEIGIVVIFLNLAALYSVLKKRSQCQFANSSIFFICIMIYLSVVFTVFNLFILAADFFSDLYLSESISTDADQSAENYDLFIRLLLASDDGKMWTKITGNYFWLGLLMLSLNQFFVFYSPYLNSKIFKSKFVFVIGSILLIVSFALTAMLVFYCLIIFGYINILETFYVDVFYYIQYVGVYDVDYVLYIIILLYALIGVELRFQLTWRIKSGKDFFKPITQHVNEIQTRCAWSLATYCVILIALQYVGPIAIYLCEIFLYDPVHDAKYICDKNIVTITFYVFNSNSMSFLIALLNGVIRKTFLSILK